MGDRNIKSELELLFQGQRLDKNQAYDVLTSIGKGQVDSMQIAAFLTCFRMRPITAQEIAGFRKAMIELAVPVDLQQGDLIDLCGTGGDGKNTFNISTTASFVVAGAGYKVAKHGNYGVSSPCGSSNVLEHLGYRMTNDVDKLKRDLDRGNFCYMHAPLFHPAMKEVGPVRKGLGIKTFFNVLGPLLNPSRPTRQITGVFHEDLIPLYQGVFEDMGSIYAVVRSTDGYDEISLTSPFSVATNDFVGNVAPTDLGLPILDSTALEGGSTVDEAASVLVNVLAGKGSDAQTQVVCANAALAIQRFQTKSSLESCYELASEAIANGQALLHLQAVTDQV